jgi:hypothetical protein
MAASAVHALARHRRAAAVLLVPALGYYLLVIVPINFVYSRFLLPPIAMLCILTGMAGASLIGGKRFPRPARLVLPALTLILSLGYAASVTLEMIFDSRYQAEEWLTAHVPRPSSVGAFSDAQYLPRAFELGYATYLVEMRREAFERPQPEYLILSSYNYEDFDDEQQECMRDLLAGRLGYGLVAHFGRRFLGTESFWPGAAGWGAPLVGKASPTVVILRRVSSQPGNDAR